MNGSHVYTVTPKMHEDLMEVIAPMSRDLIAQVLWARFSGYVREHGGDFMVRLIDQLIATTIPTSRWVAEAVDAGLRTIPNGGRGTSIGIAVGAVQVANLLAHGADIPARAQLMTIIEGYVFLHAEEQGRKYGRNVDDLMADWIVYLKGLTEAS